jgi:hypothetical protein
MGGPVTIECTFIYHDKEIGMRPFTGLMALAAIATFGIVGNVDAADTMSDQGQMEKQQQQGIQQESEMGLKEKSSESMAPKGEQRELGAGPMGEESKGGSGQSGTKGLPPSKAPGFEGGNKEPGRAPTAGGH